jgi:uncharacterized membrane protein YbhN (UPF0104 family)
MPSRKSLLSVATTALKAGLFLGLVAYLVFSGSITLKGVAALMLPRNLPLVAVSAALFFGAQALGAARLRCLLAAAGMPVGFGACFQLTMQGCAVNIFLPGTVGGDIFKGYLLVKDPAGGRPRSPGIIVMDRVVGMMSLVTLSGLSALYLLGCNEVFRRQFGGQAQTVFWVVVACAAAAVLLPVCAGSPRIRAAVKKALASVSPDGMVYQAAAGFGAVGGAPAALARALGMSVLLQAMSVGGLVTLAGTMGGAMPPRLDLAAVSAVVSLLSMVPLTPGNIGWAEMMGKLGWASVGSGAGAAAFLNWRIVMTLCAVPWGMSVLFGRKG